MGAEAIFGGVVLLLGCILSLVIAYLDYTWAPEGEKYEPKFQGPKNCADAFLAVIGIFIKIVVIELVSDALFMGMMEDLGGFCIAGTGILFLFCPLMFTIYLPWTCSDKKTPSMNALLQQFSAEVKEYDQAKFKYIKENIGSFFWGIVTLPCTICQPQKFVTTGGAFIVLLYVGLLGGFALAMYMFLRTLISGYTYKLFTFSGWLEEVINLVKIKKRFKALDYPKYWSEERRQEYEKDPSTFRKKEAAAKAAGDAEAKKEAQDMVKTGAKTEVKGEAQDAAVGAAGAQMAGTTLAPLLGQLCMAICEFFTEIVFGVVMQLLAIGFACHIAKKALQTHNKLQQVVPSDSADASELA